MGKEMYLEAEMVVVKIQKEDIIRTSNPSKEDDGPVELPFVPRK